MNAPRVCCEYCDNVTASDLYCYVKERWMSEAQARATRKCESFSFNSMSAITLQFWEPPKPKPDVCETLKMEVE